MNKSGVWKSLELKADETKEAKKNDSRTSSKDSSPDTGIVIKVSVSCTLLDSVKMYFIIQIDNKETGAKTETGDEEERVCLVSSEVKE